MEAVVGLLLVGSLLVVAYWASAVHRQGHRVLVWPGEPAPRPGDRPLGAAATVLAVARADGIAGIGRHDDRRCAH